jgi:hypothetical protein
METSARMIEMSVGIKESGLKEPAAARKVLRQVAKQNQVQ